MCKPNLGISSLETLMSKNPNNPRGLSGKEIFWIFAIYFVLYSMLATLGFLGVEFFLSTPGMIILLVGWIAVPAIATFRLD